MTECLDLEPKLDIAASEALIYKLKKHRGADLALDAGAVSHIGGHALQTLLVAARSWSADGNALSVLNIGPDLAGQLESFGISPDQLSGGS